MQPAASAGPSLRVAIAAGKFQGVISSAMPIGACATSIRLVPPGATRVVAARAHGLLGEPAQELGGVGDLAAGLGQRLAHLAHDQVRELLALRDHPLERRAAGSPRARAVRARPSRRPRSAAASTAAIPSSGPAGDD